MNKIYQPLVKPTSHVKEVTAGHIDPTLGHYYQPHIIICSSVMHVHAYYGVTYEYVSVVLAENKFYMECLVRILISRLRYSVVVSRDLKHNTQFKALGGNYSKVIGISY